MNLTSAMRMLVQSLALLSELRIWCCYELWCGLAPAALIRPLAWELPYAAGEKEKNKQKEPSGEGC